MNESEFVKALAAALKSADLCIVNRDDLQRVLDGEPCGDGSIGEVEWDRWAHATDRLQREAAL